MILRSAHKRDKRRFTWRHVQSVKNTSIVIDLVVISAGLTFENVFPVGDITMMFNHGHSISDKYWKTFPGVVNDVKHSS